MKALLFDMDGTVADTEPVHLEALRRMLRAYGADPDIEGFHDRIAGRTSPAVAAEFFPDASPATRHAFVEAKEQLFRDLADHIVPAPGLMPLLEAAARQGIKTALVTNAPPENVDLVLGALGLEGRFDAIVLACQLARPKPDPLAYTTALDRLAVAPGDAIAFEDSLPGIRSATGAGVRCVGLSTSLPRQALLDAGACCVIRDFTGFPLTEAA